MATIDKDLLLDKIDRLLKLHSYAREDWFANAIHNTVWDAPEIETDGDLISRADAIDAAGEWMQKEFGYLDLNRAERLIDALSSLPSAEAVQGWIPCSERLPDWKDMVEGVIITTENGRVTFADYSTENGTFHDVGQDVWASDIIAWMPLPKPWKGADDED